MAKTILITGATDGIGLETAKELYSAGHHVLLHGRNSQKLEEAQSEVTSIDSNGSVRTYMADLSRMTDVKHLAEQIRSECKQLDVLINNAGVFKAHPAMTSDGFELRLAVNALAPYYLTQMLLPMINRSGRIVNLSSAAQAPVDISGIKGNIPLSENAAYAQSKLLLTMWSRHLGLSHAQSGPVIFSVNPKSFLGSKMVKEAYGVAGGDIKDGSDILVRAALSPEFEQASGLYFDNDIGRFSDPHPEALNESLVAELVEVMDRYLLELAL